MDFSNMTPSEIRDIVSSAQNEIRKREVNENLKARQFTLALDAARAGFGKAAVKNQVSGIIDEAYDAYAAQQANEAVVEPTV